MVLGGFRSLHVLVTTLTWVMVQTQEKVIDEGDFVESTECIF